MKLKVVIRRNEFYVIASISLDICRLLHQLVCFVMLFPYQRFGNSLLFYYIVRKKNCWQIWNFVIKRSQRRRHDAHWSSARSRLARDLFRLKRLPCMKNICKFRKTRRGDFPRWLEPFIFAYLDSTRLNPSPSLHNISYFRIHQEIYARSLS